MTQLLFEYTESKLQIESYLDQILINRNKNNLNLILDLKYNRCYRLP